MTYGGFLARFLVVPIVLLVLARWALARRGRPLPAGWRGWPFWPATWVHVVLALVYTTPWDNYLVASGVWYYDPRLVAGIVLGWVPLEEYTFFVLQPILASLWLAVILQVGLAGAPGTPLRPSRRARVGAVAVVALPWAVAVAVLVAGWRPGTYLGLELAWGLPPVMLQLGFGADILWRHRRVVGSVLVPVTAYLAAADALAIASGTWTIDPAQSLGWFVGVLPVEELVFFLLTTTLVTFGMVLLLAEESGERIGAREGDLVGENGRAPTQGVRGRLRSTARHTR